MNAPSSTPFYLTLVGHGNMGAALFKAWCDGLLGNDFPTDHLSVIDPHILKSQLPEGIKSAQTADEISSHLSKADIVVLAVKPDLVPQVSQEIGHYIPSSCTVISIAAGQTLKNISSHFFSEQPVIRIMPNTPAMISKGMSVGVCNEHVSDDTKQNVDTLFQMTGLIEWIEDEALMNAVTALSGSGPAYIFHLIDVLKNAGVSIGLPENLATTLARQTVIGSSALAETSSTLTAETLRKNVTSPGGTTEAALKVLMDGRLDDLYKEALNAAQKRGQELS